MVKADEDFFQDDTKLASTETPIKTISEVLSQDPLLPNEPKHDYQQGLKELITELGAKTILQVYLAEKIYDCLWWIRRYEEQKRATIIFHMTRELGKNKIPDDFSRDQIQFREALLADEVDQEIVKIAAKSGYSLASLQQRGMQYAQEALQSLDQRIALLVKILAGLQASYEIAFNRKLNRERLLLQNAMMRRDLQALDAQEDDESKKATR